MYVESLGCLTGKVDLRDYKVCASGLSDVIFPKQFQLENLPQVKNQGSVSSCCPHVVSEILEWHDKNQRRLSTNFIYGIKNSVTGRDTKGMYLTDACKIVKQYGDMTYEDCPGNREVPYCFKEAEQALQDDIKKTRAYYYRIESYYSCDNVEDIKYALMHYGPVLACIFTYSDYEMTDSYEWIFDKNSTNRGGHAILIYGWNEKGWLCQNSWGTEFGNGGRMIVPFEDVVESKVLVDYVNDQDQALKKPMQGTLADFIYKTLNFFINLLNDALNKIK